MGVFKLENKVIRSDLFPYGYNEAKYIPPVPDPYFANVSLLLTDNAVDRSLNNFSITNNNALVDNNFGRGYTNSLYFNGTNAYLTLPNNAAFKFGTGDFTLEGWFYKPRYTNPGGESIWQLDEAIFASNTSTNNFLFYFHNQHGRALVWAATWSALFSSPTSFPLHQWSHLAFSRLGGNLYVFLNGFLQKDPEAYAYDHNPNSTFVVGGRAHNDNSRYGLYWVNDLRITKGVCRYTKNFTPPVRLIDSIP